jgi:dTDP-glucose 4,6-dehydratase
MKILITGAAGFIGSHLGNRLTQLGHEVVGYDSFVNPSDNKTNFRIEHIDCRKLTTLQGYDAVFHLAAFINVDESIKYPDDYFDNNVAVTMHLLDLVRSSKTKFIYASSAEVYGSAQYPIISEDDHPLDPLSPYAVSKLASEQFCKVYAQLYGLDVTVVRNFNTFGEFQRGGVYGGVIAKFAHLGAQGLNLPVYGSGEQTRDYMHVSQAVDGYVLALERKLPIIVNFGSGSEVKIVDIANRIATKFGVSLVHEKPRPGELMRLRADVSRAKQYGYNVTTDFWTHLDNYLEHVATSESSRK